MSLHLVISTSPKRKLRNNIDVIDYFAGDNEMSRPESAAASNAAHYVLLTVTVSQKKIKSARKRCKGVRMPTNIFII